MDSEKNTSVKNYPIPNPPQNILQDPEGWVGYLNSNPQVVFNGSLNYNIIQLSRKGIPYTHARSVFKKLGLDVKQMSDIIGITDRTFQRNLKEKKLLNINQSEKVLEAGVLLHRGITVFGSHDAFLEWLNTDNPVFNGKPILFIDTNTGINLLVSELNRIEHGIY